MAQKIRHCQDIKLIILYGTTHITSLYADDLLLFLDHAPSSLPNVMNIISSFGLISGYKTNLKKSALLPLNIAMTDRNYQSEIPLVTTFKYLGLDIYDSLDTIVNTNYKKLFKLTIDHLVSPRYTDKNYKQNNQSIPLYHKTITTTKQLCGYSMFIQLDSVKVALIMTCSEQVLLSVDRL